MRRNNSKTFRGLLIFALFVSVVTSANSAFAQRTATRPAAAGPLARLRGALSALAAARNAGQSIDSTRAEWDEILKFLDVNSPIRAAALRQAGLSPAAPLRLAITRYYRGYLILDEKLPEIADLRRKRMRIEDDIFDLVVQNREGKVNANDFKYKIQEKEAALFDNGLDEQTKRLEMLKNLYDDESQKLDQQKNLRQSIIGSRTNLLINRQQSSSPSPGGGSAPASQPTLPQTKVDTPSSPLTGSLVDNISDEQWAAEMTAFTSAHFPDELQFPAFE
jgi:hypothetical protein